MFRYDARQSGSTSSHRVAISHLGLSIRASSSSCKGYHCEGRLKHTQDSIRTWTAACEFVWIRQNVIAWFIRLSCALVCTHRSLDVGISAFLEQNSCHLRKAVRDCKHERRPPFLAAANPLPRRRRRLEKDMQYLGRTSVLTLF